MSDNLRVYLRIRPSNQDFSQFTIINEKNIRVPTNNKIYPFDHIFQGPSSQATVFRETAEPMIKSFLLGYNCAYFVNGQTGTGKTHTMGLLHRLVPSEPSCTGIVPDFFRALFSLIAATHQKPTIHLSFLQIYCDEIRDLLNPEAKNLAVLERKDRSNETFVKDLIETPVNSVADAFEIISHGLVFRKMGSQKMNKTSSRSHTILTIYQKTRGSPNVESSFSFVDLAGAERVKKSSSDGKRLEEAKTINFSLSVLANVISSLAKSKDEIHVPFRDNKLTRVLQGSLSGRAKIAIMATISDNPEFLSETAGTLDFAMRCKGLSIKPSIQTFSETQNYQPEKFSASFLDEDSPIEDDKQKEEAKEFVIKEPSKSDVLATYLIKILRGLRKLMIKEGKRETKGREGELKEKFHDFAGKLKYSFDFQKTTVTNGLSREMEKLDEKYPSFVDGSDISDHFPNEFDESFVFNGDLNDLISKVQILADFLVKGLRHSLSQVDSLKQELDVWLILRRKRDEELENWSSCLNFLMKTLLEKQQECLHLSPMKLDQLNFEQKTTEFMKEIARQSEEIINRNRLYSDLDFLRESMNILKSSGFSQRIRDFSLMESLQTLQKYSSNQQKQPNLNDLNHILREEGPANPAFLEIYQKESSQLPKIIIEQPKELPLVDSFPRPTPVVNPIPREISINLGELTEIKKDHREMHEETSHGKNESKSQVKGVEGSNEKERSHKTNIEVPEESQTVPLKISLTVEPSKLSPMTLQTPSKTSNSPLKKPQKPPNSIVIKYLENEIMNETRGNAQKGRQEPEEPATKERLSSNSKNRTFPTNDLVRSAFERNSVKTRHNTVILKDRSPSMKSPHGKSEAAENIKKKSEINDEASLIKFLDQNLKKIDY